MKIICIGQNYQDHVKEMKSSPTEVPMFFVKPESSLLLRNRPFYYPDFTKELHYEGEIVVRINRVGKHIQEKFAHRYYSEVGFGIDLTARDLQRECKEHGRPWEIAKGFEHSAPLSPFVSLEELGMEIGNIPFRLDLNGKTVQQGNTGNMIYTVDRIIAYVSLFMTLKIGDMIFTGTPEGVGPLAIGDRLEGYIGDRKMISLKIK
ncbi:MAG: fumarylacetoacetate hydrolase family protein [Bacteroidales bacterium]